MQRLPSAYTTLVFSENSWIFKNKGNSRQTLNLADFSPFCCSLSIVISGVNLIWPTTIVYHTERSPLFTMWWLWCTGVDCDSWDLTVCSVVLSWGRPRTALMDNINTWTGLPIEESVSMTEGSMISTSIVWPTLGLRTAREQNGTDAMLARQTDISSMMSQTVLILVDYKLTSTW